MKKAPCGARFLEIRCSFARAYRLVFGTKYSLWVETVDGPRGSMAMSKSTEPSTASILPVSAARSSAWTSSHAATARISDAIEAAISGWYSLISIVPSFMVGAAGFEPARALPTAFCEPRPICERPLAGPSVSTFQDSSLSCCEPRPGTCPS